jgi:hypothetical protein
MVTHVIYSIIVMTVRASQRVYENIKGLETWFGTSQKLLRCKNTSPIKSTKNSLKKIQLLATLSIRTLSTCFIFLAYHSGIFFSAIFSVILGVQKNRERDWIGACVFLLSFPKLIIWPIYKAHIRWKLGACAIFETKIRNIGFRSDGSKFIMLFNPSPLPKVIQILQLTPSPSMGDTCEPDDVFSCLDRCYFVRFSNGWFILKEKYR